VWVNYYYYYILTYFLQQHRKYICHVLICTFDKQGRIVGVNYHLNGMKIGMNRRGMVMVGVGGVLA
jgi:hypothetical protein